MHSAQSRVQNHCLWLKDNRILQKIVSLTGFIFPDNFFLFVCYSDICCRSSQVSILLWRNPMWWELYHVDVMHPAAYLPNESWWFPAGCWACKHSDPSGRIPRSWMTAKCSSRWLTWLRSWPSPAPCWDSDPATFLPAGSLGGVWFHQCRSWIQWSLWIPSCSGYSVL